MKRKFYCCRFYVTYKCVSSCSFCDVHSKIYARCQPMALKDAEKVIRDVYELGVRYIDFTGGEPMLSPNLPQITKIAKSLGIKTEITTSGALGMTETTRRCAETADKFNISLDSLSPAVYASIRGTNSLSRTLEVIRETSRIRQANDLSRVKIMTALTIKNLPEIHTLLKFAEDSGSEIYFNPVFAYFDGCDEPDYKTVIPVLESLTFKKNAVIMLHFLEFYRSSVQDHPICSANKQTITIAPDGRIIVPCYHSRQKVMLDYSTWLKDYVNTPEFMSHSTKIYSKCTACRVSPYFGISFSFRLDKFFLLASFSEKLVHLKRDYLNDFDLYFDDKNLLLHLQELKAIINSLAPSPQPEGNALYYAERRAGEWYSPIYRHPISEEHYEKDLTASDCWTLERVPHREFDSICSKVFPKIVNELHSNYEDKELRDILSLAQEFMLRWWKYYVSIYFKTSILCDIKSEVMCINEYFTRICKRFPEFQNISIYLLKVLQSR